MNYFCKAIIIGCILSLASSVPLDSNTQILSKQWIIPAQSTFMNTEYLIPEAGSYVYGNCSVTNICDITVENSNEIRVCTLRLLADPERVLQVDLNQLSPRLFGKQKVIISHRERSALDMYQVITVTDMSSCHTTYLTYKYKRMPELLLTNVVVHEKTFEVIFGGGSACAGLEKCKITYDQNARRLGEPSPFQTDLVLFQTEVAEKNSYFLFGLTDRPFKLRAAHVDGLGRETVLTQANLFDPYKAPRTFSSSHDLLGVCWYNSSYPHDPAKVVECKQFDVRKRLVMEVWVPNLGIVSSMVVHNFEKGGILLMASEDSEIFKVIRISRCGEIREIQLGLPRGLLNRVTDDPECVCFHFTKLKYDSRSGLLKYYVKCVPTDVIV